MCLKPADGIHWGRPLIGYEKANLYFYDGKNLRPERPQVLLRDGKPKYLFLAVQGGKYGTSSGGVLKIQEQVFDEE